MLLSRDKTTKFLFVALILLGIFVGLHPVVTADSGAHCEASDVHVHSGTSIICGGTLAYTIYNFYEASNVFGRLVETFVGIVISAAFFYFFWNLVKYIRDEGSQEDAKTRMGWSLVAIFVIVTLWGIIGFMRDALGVSRIDSPPILNLPVVGFTECSSGSYRYDIDAQTASSLGIKAESGCATKPCYKSDGTPGVTACADSNLCNVPGCSGCAGGQCGSGFKQYTP